MNKSLFVHWKCFVLWLAHTTSIFTVLYIQVEILSQCFLHVHRLYDATASPGSRLRSHGSSARTVVPPCNILQVRKKWYVVNKKIQKRFNIPDSHQCFHDHDLHQFLQRPRLSRPCEYRVWCPWDLRAGISVDLDQKRPNIWDSRAPYQDCFPPEFWSAIQYNIQPCQPWTHPLNSQRSFAFSNYRCLFVYMTEDNGNQAHFVPALSKAENYKVQLRKI